MINKYRVEPRYVREDGLVVFDIDPKLLALDFDVKEHAVVQLPPKTVAGNHSHPRLEAFIGIGSGLELFWIDENGKTHTELMNPDNKFLLFTIPPHAPHAVRNNSEKTAILIEYANALQTDEDITLVKVI